MLWYLNIAKYVNVNLNKLLYWVRGKSPPLPYDYSVNFQSINASLIFLETCEELENCQVVESKKNIEAEYFESLTKV